MIKIYSFLTIRNKLEDNGMSIINWKKKLYNKICDNCKKDFNLSNLDLEHKIPVRIAGSLIDITNLRLFCHKCHYEKTRKDIIVINILKRLKLLEQDNCFIEPLKLHEIYSYLYNLLKEGESNFKIWEYGSNGSDYEQIIYKKNREKINNGS